MRPKAAIAAIIAAAALSASPSASAEVEQQGDVIVGFDGGIAPRALPRTELAPVAVSIKSSFKSAQGKDPPPQLRKIAIAINRAGEIFDRGLPTCRVREIQPATIKAARRICGEAIVGEGRVGVRVHLENQQPFTFKAPLLVFNAERHAKKRRLLAQVYGTKPPSAFVLNFKISRRQGTFGTLIATTLPRPARKWAYVTNFEMRLKRTYAYRGERHSYISAGCAAPEGFPGAVYPFARASFGFAGGLGVSTTLVRDCLVRG